VFPELTDVEVDAFIYPTSQSGRTRPVPDGYRCPIFPDPNKREGYDCIFNFEGLPIQPGEYRRIGLALLVPEISIPILKAVGTFYFWELGLFGEGRLISVKHASKP
jgi:hypothetical protein